MSLPKLTKNKIIIVISLLLFIILTTAAVTYFSVKIEQTATFKPLPAAPSSWKITRSKDYNISFAYPKWMAKRFEGGNYPSWILYNDKNGDRLIDITLTSLTLDDARKSYPNLSFAPFSLGAVSGWGGNFIGKDKQIVRKLYIFKLKNNNIWLLADLSRFKNNNQAEQTIKKIIQSADTL